MESSRERACPSCSASAAASQRWCLECGAELPAARRSGLRPVVGIATALAVLVGAASAGGYTLLQTGRQPPPPTTTVAQAPAPAPTPPPATQEALPVAPNPRPLPLPSYTTPRLSTGTTGTHTGGAGVATTPQTTTGGQPGGSTVPQPPPKAQTALVNVALGAAAVVYAPYAAADADLGDASRVVDGTTRTAWKTPVAPDPTVAPLLGVYVDLASREQLRSLVIETPTPGMNVEIYGAEQGPPATITEDGWDHIATRADLFGTTKVRLPKRPFRYVLVWITALPPNGDHAAISELSLLSVQPE